MTLGSREQTGLESSFIGGRPKLPEGQTVPACGLCGLAETFFIQIAFPSDHIWTGVSLAIFSCTSCVDSDHLIPTMLPDVRAGHDIPDGFLAEYQSNFHLLVFRTASATDLYEYGERVAYRTIELGSSDPESAIGHVGGAPVWILDDESPATYASKLPMAFLLQLNGDLRFQTVPGAPSQVSLNIQGEPEALTNSYYQLFLGNTLYLFGTQAKSSHMVYAITQVE